MVVYIDHADSELYRMLGAVVALTIGLTFGASYGWKTPSFLVPFLLSPVLFILFFFYEAQLPVERAILPSQTWKIPNFTITIVFALGMTSWYVRSPFAYFPLALLMIPYFQVGSQLPRLHSSLHLGQQRDGYHGGCKACPRGHGSIGCNDLFSVSKSPLLSDLILICIPSFFPSVLGNARFSIFLGTLLGIAAYIMFAQSHTMVGKDYWRYIFPPMIFGSAGVMVAYTGVNVLIMTSVPSEIAGVAGSVLQVSLQVGSAVALSVQAGLLTIHPGSIYNSANVHASYYFQLGVTALLLITFIVFYKPSKAPASATSAVSPVVH